MFGPRASVKLADLKQMKPPTPKGVIGSRYSPIPHHGLLTALCAESPVPGGPPLKFSANVNDAGTIMVSVGRLHDDGADVRPTLVVVSGHTRRQPAEVYYGYEFLTPTGSPFGLLVGRGYDSCRHTINADVDAFAVKVRATFARGGTKKARTRIADWLDDCRGTKMAADDMIRRFEANLQLSVNPSRFSMLPFMRSDRNRFVNMVCQSGAEIDGWPRRTAIGFLRAAVELIDMDSVLFRAVYRKYALLLGEDCPRPPDVYAE